MLENRTQADNSPSPPENQPKIGYDSTTTYSSSLYNVFTDDNFDYYATTYGWSTLSLSDGGTYLQVQRSGGASGSFWTLPDNDSYWPIFVHDVVVQFRYQTNALAGVTFVLEILDDSGNWQTASGSFGSYYSVITPWSPQSVNVYDWNIGSYANPFQIRFSFSSFGTSDYVNFDYIYIRARNYTITENSASVEFGTPMTIKTNVTTKLDPASTLKDVELQYDYDNDWSNGIGGVVANTTKADSEMTFVIPGWAVHWAGTDGTMYYRIHQWTVAGQHYFSTNETISPNQPNFQVTDSVAPNCNFVSQNATISYNQPMQVIYSILDQVNGSGFNFDTGVVYLYYKVNSLPVDATDGTAVRYNVSLNTGITPGITQVNYANFTIQSSAYSYGDQVYHWVVVQDRAGNSNDTFANLQSFIVGDSVTPTQVSAAANAVNASFNQDKLVTFTVTDPDPGRGSGVDASSVKCYWANGSTFSPMVQAAFQGQVGNDFTFLIPKETAHYGRLDQTVYFRINASDNAGNPILSGNVYSYQVSDMQAPIMTWIADNFSSNPNYIGDTVFWRATFEDPDAPNPWPSTCSKLSTAFLYVRNSTGAPVPALINVSSQYNATIPSNISVSGQLSVTVEFVIPDNVLSARQQMYYLIQVNDSRYGVFNYTGNFHVKDSVMPVVTFSRVRNTTDGTIINYNEDAVFWFYATEPVDASGFADSIRTKTVVWYKVANSLTQEPTSALDYTGSTIIYNSTFSSYTGGWFEFRVPNAAFAYNQYVWAWVNITDTQYNYNNTFQLGQVPWVRINDTINSNFTWGPGQNDNPNSYHLNKSIQFNASEPLDASGLAAIRLYWRINFTANQGYTNFTDITNFTQFNVLVLFANITPWNFYYGNTIHYVLQVTDVAGNVFNTTDRWFSIIDTKPPDYISSNLNTEFFWVQPGKSKNFTFTISDPDYGVLAPHRSSGIKNISFYYRLMGKDNGFLFNGSFNVPFEGGTVTFQLPYNVTFTQYPDDHTLYYEIIVYDQYGTSREYNSSILLADTVIIAATSPKALPWTLNYYHNSQSLTFRFVFTGTLLSSQPFSISSVLWYQREDGPIFGPILPDGDLSISVTFPLLAEGWYNITFWNYNETDAQFGFLKFKIDVTPPAKPSSISAEYTDNGVQLTWTAVSDEDAITYIIYRGTFPDFDPLKDEGIIVQKNLVTTSIVDDDVLMDMTTYYYKVYAVDPAGNLSAVAAETSFSKPLPMWMWIILAGVAMAVVVGIVMVARARGERKLLMAAMEKSEKSAPVSKEADWSQIAAAARKRQESTQAASKEGATKAAAGDGKKWATIQTTAAAKPSTPQAAPVGRGAYWKGELGELLAKVVQAEEAGNYAEELRVLEIVQRVAQQMQDQETLTMAQQKIKDVWAKLNA